MAVFQRRSKRPRFALDRSKPLPKEPVFTVAPRGKGTGRFLMTVVFLLGGIVVLAFPTGGPVLREGRIAGREYRARVSFDAPDDDATHRAREETAGKTLRVFQQNTDHLTALPRALDEFLKLVTEVRNADELQDRAREDWGLTRERLVGLKATFDLKWLGDGLEALRGGIDKAARRGIISAAERQSELDARRYEIKVRDRAAGEEGRNVSVYRTIGYPGGVREFFATESLLWFREKPAVFQEIFLDMIVHAATPTLKLDGVATDAAMREARANAPIQRREIVKGSIILDIGDRVTRKAIEEIAREEEAFGRLPKGVRDSEGGSEHLVRQILGAAGLTAVFVLGFLVLAFYGVVFAAGALTSNTRVFGVYAMCLFTLVALRVIEYFALPLYVTPVILAAIVLVVACGPNLALGATVLLAVLAGTATDGGMALSVSLLVGGIVAVLGLTHVKRRTDPMEAGALAGLASAACVWAFHLVAAGSAAGRPPWPVVDSLAALGGGVLAGMALMASLPYVEQVFDVATDPRLLEWTDQNQPLLRKLALEAPGTYHHSTIVGNMAEAAAEAIGANSLLARAGAYLHDVGKLNRPDYFIENTVGRASRHDGLTPSMSTLILTAHPQDGAELAKRYGVPSPLRRIILEHHGTYVAQFFYGQACKENEENAHAPDEHDYRYRGPKPKSRESAIVMLADAAESASRTMVNPSPGRIEGLVREIVDHRLQDGQLDESRMSITDIRRVETSLVRGLTAVSHPRIRYPGL